MNLIPWLQSPFSSRIFRHQAGRSLNDNHEECDESIGQTRRHRASISRTDSAELRLMEVNWKTEIGHPGGSLGGPGVAEAARRAGQVAGPIEVPGHDRERQVAQRGTELEQAAEQP